MWEPQLKLVYEDLLDSQVRITQKPQCLEMSVHFDLIHFSPSILECLFTSI